jgi:hypothetical protein
MQAAHWQRREPVGAIILIALGVLLLLGQFDWFSWHIFQYFWPMVLIGLGVWLIVRRVHETRGVPASGAQSGPQSESQDSSQGGQQ